MDTSPPLSVSEFRKDAKKGYKRACDWRKKSNRDTSPPLSASESKKALKKVCGWRKNNKKQENINCYCVYWSENSIPFLKLIESNYSQRMQKRYCGVVSECWKRFL